MEYTANQEYTVNQLAKIAGVSARTLRYYDQIGLLKPARVTEAGYRIYGPREVDRLQQIPFYRELGVRLETIREIVADPGFDELDALREHYRLLVQQRARLDKLIATLAKTIRHREEGAPMRDEEKFQGFKQKLIQENEAKYGEEARKRFGDQSVDASNAKLMGLSQQEFEAMTALSEEIMALLKEAHASGDPASPPARKLAEKHKEWLTYMWPEYSEEAHAHLAEMYVADERFTAYYDQAVEGGTEFLRDAILSYLGRG